MTEDAHTDTAAEILRALHGLMKDEGLFSRGMESYWYSIWDALVYELAPEMMDE